MLYSSISRDAWFIKYLSPFSSTSMGMWLQEACASLGTNDVVWCHSGPVSPITAVSPLEPKWSLDHFSVMFWGSRQSLRWHMSKNCCYLCSRLCFCSAEYITVGVYLMGLKHYKYKKWGSCNHHNFFNLIVSIQTLISSVLFLTLNQYSDYI